MKVDRKCISSFEVFMSFVHWDESGTCDTSSILSTACFDLWINSRKKKPQKPAEAFRRALTAHCRGSDGRRWFPERVEQALLKDLRKKRRWRCFDHLDIEANIGLHGFPSLGYHEKKRRKEHGNQIQSSSEDMQLFIDPSHLSNLEGLKRKFPFEKMSLKKTKSEPFVKEEIQSQGSSTRRNSEVLARDFFGEGDALEFDFSADLFHSF